MNSVVAAPTVMIAVVCSLAWCRPAAAAGGAEEGGSPVRCEGAYADDLSALKLEARDFDRRPEATFSRCTRDTAVYECLSYGQDGAVRRKQKRVVAHGTAFGYRRQGGDTLLLTNDHVASWPPVTDAQHLVEGVPPGCKRISEALSLVDDEHDTYARDDVPVTRIVSDPQLDVAILRAHAELPILAWKIGHSGALTERNVVEVRGFPLGAFRATNLGKVISANDHDDYRDWDHDDFVIDALLSDGNSGSPVLAISCATGEYELVGIFHAGYTGGSALNVVVGIDQVRDLMNTLKRSPQRSSGDVAMAGAAGRSTVVAALGGLDEMFFPFGTLVAQVRRGPGDRLYFLVFGKDFPSSSEPILVLEDRPATAPVTFGDLGAVWLGSARGLKRYEGASLDGDTLGQLTRTLDALRVDAVGHAAYRSDALGVAGSRQAAERRARTAKVLARVAASRSDLCQTVADLSDRLGPSVEEIGTTMAALFTVENQPLRPVAEPPGTLGKPLAYSEPSSIHAGDHAAPGAGPSAARAEPGPPSR